MALRERGRPPTRRPDVWTPELLGKIEWRVRAAAEAFRGVSTTDGPHKGLFPLTNTGVAVTGTRRAVEDYLAALTGEELRDPVGGAVPAVRRQAGADPVL